MQLARFAALGEPALLLVADAAVRRHLAALNRFFQLEMQQGAALYEGQFITGGDRMPAFLGVKQEGFTQAVDTFGEHWSADVALA